MTAKVQIVPFYPGQVKYSHERSISKAVSSDLITESDRDTITRFIDDKQVQDHISQNRVNKLVSTLVNWRRFLAVPYQEITYDDVSAGIAAMKSGKSVKGQPLEANTQHDYIRILKMFLAWLYENSHVKLPMDKIKKIKAPKQNFETTSPDEILTKDEIEKLLLACTTSRDRAVIGLLYESGMRVAELARLRWKDIQFDEYGVKLYIDDQKNAKKRYSRITMMTQYLSQWRNDYDGQRGKEGLPVPNAPVFITRERQTFTYVTVIRILERAMNKAGITRKITPHLFRKSRITHMVSQGYQESVVKKSMWNNLNTTMFKTYVALGEKQIDDEFLTQAGVKTKEERDQDALKPLPCYNCGLVNPPTAGFCMKCGAPTKDETKDRMQALTQRIDQVDIDALIEQKVQEALKAKGAARPNK
jgi:site-specific recombinase XerD